MKYSAKVTALRNSNMSLRKDHTVNAGGEKIGQLNAGQAAEGEETWTAPADGLNVKRDDLWLHVLKANGAMLPVPAWVAIVHMGSVYCDLTENTSQPPAGESPFVAAKLIRANGEEINFVPVVK